MGECEKFLGEILEEIKFSIVYTSKGVVALFIQKLLPSHSYDCSIFKILYVNVRVVAPGTVCPGAIYVVHTI